MAMPKHGDRREAWPYEDVPEGHHIEWSTKRMAWIAVKDDEQAPISEKLVGLPFPLDLTEPLQHALIRQEEWLIQEIDYLSKQLDKNTLPETVAERRAGRLVALMRQRRAVRELMRQVAKYV